MPLIYLFMRLERMPQELVVSFWHYIMCSLPKEDKISTLSVHHFYLSWMLWKCHTYISPSSQLLNTLLTSKSSFSPPIFLTFLILFVIKKCLVFDILQSLQYTMNISKYIWCTFSPFSTWHSALGRWVMGRQLCW